MGDDDRREILERLEAIERRLRSRHDDRGGERGERRHGRDRRDHHRDHHERRDRDHDRRGERDGDFEEKRIVDTIVHLVTEQVGRMLQDQQARARSRDDGGDEKRIVDLVVRLVSEHVQEIVATELDRRLGSPSPDRESLPDQPDTGGCEGAPDDE